MTMKQIQYKIKDFTTTL